MTSELNIIEFLYKILKEFSYIASILGFLISLYVLKEIKNITKKFLFRVRVPDLLASLKTIATDLSQNLNSFDESRREIDTCLSRCDSTLRNLIKKVDRETKKTTKQLLSSIKKKSKPLNKDEVWNIFTDLLGLIDTLGHIQKDIKWGS